VRHKSELLHDETNCEDPEYSIRNIPGDPGLLRLKLRSLLANGCQRAALWTQCASREGETSTNFMRRAVEDRHGANWMRTIALHPASQVDPITR
jgi:hypothetical protein